MEDKLALLKEEFEDITKTNKEILEKLDILERKRNGNQRGKQSNGEEQSKVDGKGLLDTAAALDGVDTSSGHVSNVTPSASHNNRDSMDNTGQSNDIKGPLDDSGQIPGAKAADVSCHDDQSFLTTPGFKEMLSLQMEHVLYGSCLKRNRCNMNQDNRICFKFSLTPNQGGVYAARESSKKEVCHTKKEVCRPKFVAKRLLDSAKKTAESEKKQNVQKDFKQPVEPKKEIAMKKRNLDRIEPRPSSLGGSESAKQKEKADASIGSHKSVIGSQSKDAEKSSESSKNLVDQTKQVYEPFFPRDEEKPVIIDPNQWVEEANREIKVGSERFRGIRESGLDTVICLDVSASMRGVAWADAMKFVNGFLDWLLEKTSLRDDTFDHVALVTFGSMTGVQQHLTCDLMAVKEKVGKLVPGGPSPLNAGLILSRAAIVGVGGILSCNGYSLKPRILLITDGKFTPGSLLAGPDRCDNYLLKLQENENIVETATNIRNKEKAEIFPVPVGESDMTILELLANMTGGKIVPHFDWAIQAATYRNYRTATQIGIFQKKLGSHLTLSPELAIDSIVADILPGASENDVLQIKEFLATHEPDDDDDDDDALPLGTRVKRLEALTAPEDREVIGTVTAHLKKGRIGVTWDRCRVGMDDARENVAYGPAFKQVEVVNSPRVLKDELIAVGCRVRRGPDWRYLDQDGGKGGLGTVFNVDSNGIVNVRWDNGNKNTYRFGADAFDLEVVQAQEMGQTDKPENRDRKSFKKKDEDDASIPHTTRGLTIEEVMNQKNAELNKKAAAEAILADEKIKESKTLEKTMNQGAGKNAQTEAGREQKIKDKNEIDVMALNRRNVRNAEQTASSLPGPKEQPSVTGEGQNNGAGKSAQTEAGREQKIKDKNEVNVMALNQRNVKNAEQTASCLPGPKEQPSVTGEGQNNEEAYTWQWLNDERWQTYPEDISKQIETSFQRNPSGTTVIYYEEQQFRLIFSKMEKTNTTTKQKTKIQRR